MAPNDLSLPCLFPSHREPGLARIPHRMWQGQGAWLPWPGHKMPLHAASCIAFSRGSQLQYGKGTLSRGLHAENPPVSPSLPAVWVSHVPSNSLAPVKRPDDCDPSWQPQKSLEPEPSNWATPESLPPEAGGKINGICCPMPLERFITQW